MISRKAKEELKYKTGIEEINAISNEVEILDKKFHAYIFEVNIEELEQSDIFTKNLKYIKQDPQVKEKGTLTLGMSVMVPRKNKLFVIWGESKDRFKDLIEIIFKKDK